MAPTPGSEFEDRVASILADLDPACQVERRQRLTDRLGHDREFDIVIRGAIGGQDVLGVVECKDHKRKSGAPDIEAFITKSADVRANLVLYASKRGFTRQALAKAQHYGVGTLSLFPDGSTNDRFTLGVRWYVVQCSWVDSRITVFWSDADTSPFDPMQLRHDGLQVAAWWARKLNAAGCGFKGVELSQRLMFREPVPLETDTGLRYAAGLQFESRVERTIKTRFVRVTGRGLIRWHKDELIVPARSSINIQFADSDEPPLPDLSGWEQCKELPEKHNFGLHMEVWNTPVEANSPAPELEKLACEGT